jgi:hypothetical protein
MTSNLSSLSTSLSFTQNPKGFQLLIVYERLKQLRELQAYRRTSEEAARRADRVHADKVHEDKVRPQTPAPQTTEFAVMKPRNGFVFSDSSVAQTSAGDPTHQV